jgi:hypothetical protein
VSEYAVATLVAVTSVAGMLADGVYIGGSVLLVVLVVILILWLVGR